MEYFTLITQRGLAVIAGALSNNTLVDISEMAFGDANNSDYEPSATQSELVNEKHRVNISSIELDEHNPNWVIVKAILPADVGNFYIQEIGLYAGTTLIAVARYPRTFKPLITHGITREMHLSLIIQLDNAEVINMTIDPHLAVATKQYVNERLSQISVQGIKPFDTYADLIAYDDTSPNLAKDQFIARVNFDSDPAKNGLYAFESNEWRKIEEEVDPAVAEVSSKLNGINDQLHELRTKIHDNDGNLYSVAVVNPQSNKVLWGFSEKFIQTPFGRLSFSEGVLSVEDAGGRSPLRISDNRISILGLEFYISSNGALEVSDALGRVAVRLSPNGELFINDLSYFGIHQKETTEQVVLDLGWRRKQYNHIAVYGQSKSTGCGRPNLSDSAYGHEISTSQPYSNLMLAGGANTISSNTAYYINNAFTPLIEKTINGNNGANESPTSSVCNGFTKRLLATNAYTTAEDYIFIGTNSGDGGQSVETLTLESKYKELRAHINDVAKTSKAKNKTCALSAIVYLQGEANYQGLNRGEVPFNDLRSSNENDYKEKLIKLVDKITTDAVKAYGSNQDFLPYVFMYQVMAHRSYIDANNPSAGSLNQFSIALAQWHLSSTHDRFVIAFPDYALPTTPTDNIHYNPIGAWLAGQYIARAMDYTLNNSSQKWRPLEPISYEIAGTQIKIKCHVPFGQLRSSTRFCPQQMHDGFDVWTKNNELVESVIQSVSYDKDTIVINLNRQLNANEVISYARGRDETKPKSMGNITDTHGDVDVVIAPDNSAHYLDNSLVMFTLDPLRGF
ncbi:MAG: phage tail protein [Pseudomonadota bacterium]|nr:phage tail protein [Pseudomonadota bacterium]